MMSRIARIAAVLAGVILMLATIAGAGRLLNGNTDSPPPMPPKSTGPIDGRVVVSGVVDTQTETGSYVAPDVLGLAKVQKILVAEGQAVGEGQPLIQFDDSVPRKKLEVAKAAVKIAKAKLSQAELQKTIHPLNIELQNFAVTKAKNDLAYAQRVLAIVSEQIERTFDTNNPATSRPWTDAEKQRVRNDSALLTQSQGQVNSLTILVDKEKKDLEKLKLLNPSLAEMEAQAEVDRLQALVDEAQTVVDACVLKSGVAGIVEKILASPGQVISPQSPKPSLIVVPGGPRLVRAEVVPEFASKVAGSQGRKVMIYDNDNFNLVYEGEVVRIGSAFLPRRFAPQDPLMSNANRVLECTILVKNAQPAGMPPLRPGQPVRVSFP